jgi:alpha-mannosidase
MTERGVIPVGEPESRGQDVRVVRSGWAGGNKMYASRERLQEILRSRCKMKRIHALFFTAVLIAVSPCLFSASARAQKSAADKSIGRLDSRHDAFNVNMDRWKITTKTDADYLDPNFVPDKSWKKTIPGSLLQKSESGSWLWSNYKIPETIGGVSTRGSRVLFYPIVLQSADIYINGAWKGNTYARQGEYLVTDNASPGEEFVFLIHSFNRYGDGIFLKAGLLFVPQQDMDWTVNEYLNDLKTVRSLIEYAPDRNKWNALIEKSAAAIDLDAYDKKDFTRFGASLETARKILEPAKQFTRQFSLFVLGYSHIDLAYKWDKREGEEVWYNTTRTILTLLDKVPDWTYCAGQAAGYQYIEKKHPDLFEQIKKRVAEGRWEPVGGMWVEPDSNLPGGESFVRQLLYGKRWFREKFGKDIVVAWTPDSFGFNWNLAQIYKKAGIVGFYTQKINWNDTTKFPYNVFWWEGPDGSRILTYLPPANDTASLDTEPVLENLKSMDKNAALKESFVTIGVGDHGGGVTFTSLNRAFNFIVDPLFPKTFFTTAEKYFKHLLSMSPARKYPVWKNELYLEYHRGTYTTQGATKRNNRRGETELANAELFSTIAAIFGFKYPRADIRAAWDILMLNQFHDILPGSGINEVYRDADADYAKLFETTGAVTGDAMKTIANKIKTSGNGAALILFNPLAWEREGVVTAAAGNSGGKYIIDDKGRALPCQTVETSGGEKQLLFVSGKIPASGYSVYHVVSSAPAASGSALKITPTTLDNEFLKVTVDPKTGNITSLVDKRTKKEYFGGGRQGNILQCYRDRHEKYDAWNIKLHEQLPVALQAPPEIFESGPVRVTLRLTKTIGDSTFVHYISLVRGIPQVFGRLEVDWHESHVMAKLAFQLNLKNDVAWYEIPYAAIARPAVPKTDADRAKWEVSAQKWVDYTGADGKNGFSLLNDGKYGYDTKDNVLRMSLLRSPKDPDPEADMKHHTIEYAIYPHAGDWRSASTPRRGYEFNSPVAAIHEANHDGPLSASKSFFSAEPANVILSSVKFAEDSDAVILRLYEADGKDTTARILLPAKPKSAEETNLMEEHPKKVKLRGNKITVPIGHYEIKTLKVAF